MVYDHTAFMGKIFDVRDFNVGGFEQRMHAQGSGFRHGTLYNRRGSSMSHMHCLQVRESSPPISAL